MIASDLVTVPWPYLFSGVFGVSRCICLVHDILKWATRRCSSPLFTWQPWKQVSQHQHRCFQSVIIIIIVVIVIINIAIVIIFFVISVIMAFYWLFRINCLNLRLRHPQLSQLLAFASVAETFRRPSISRPYLVGVSNPLALGS